LGQEEVVVSFVPQPGPNAKVTDEEIDLVYRWARAERKRLKAIKP
jgi:hypothetical protein